VSDGIDQLPDDPVLLKQMIVRIRTEAAEQLEAQRLRLEAEKQAAIDAILRRFYGPRSEAFDPTQLLMFGVTVAPDTPIDPASEEAAAVEAESGQKLTSRRINHHKHGRRKLPDHLPRRQIIHDLTDEQKKCPCCGEARACIGSETSEQLEYIPAKFEVLQHIRHKYACKHCGDGKCATCDGKAHIDIAAKEAQPIEKGLPGPSLVAYVITSKLGDHLPLYRLETIFDRSSIDIARSTMCAWMLAAGKLVKPLTDLIADRVRQSQVIHTDETRVPVQDGTTKGKCKSGRIWTYVGDEANPFVVYDYTPDRTRAGPTAWLQKFSGYLQADAYGGYDGIYATGGVTEVACWAHARRKFFDARETDGVRAAQMLAMVAKLYAVEDEAKAKIAEFLAEDTAALSDERHEIIRALRQEKSQPILMEIKAWLDREKEIVLPRSPVAQAIQYTLNQWDALCRYTEHGFLSIDNNAAERALKRVAIGRKNWLFAGTDAAGASHARLWTLIASAERHGVDPQAYLRSVLAKIGSTPLSEVGQFLPDVWKQEASEASAEAGAS
jgi:transposase